MTNYELEDQAKEFFQNVVQKNKEENYELLDMKYVSRRRTNTPELKFCTISVNPRQRGMVDSWW